MTYQDRYNTAHYAWFQLQYPSAFADGFYSKPKQPPVSKANGLTQWIVNFTDWSGYHANRISSAGRMVGGKFIRGTTKKGTADISCIINGRAIMIEVKVGNDRASPEQLQQQVKVRNAGGAYEFVRTPQDYLIIFDKYTT